MTNDDSKRKKDVRNGIPHNQQDFPGFTMGDPEQQHSQSKSQDNVGKTPLPSEKECPPKDTQSQMRQKSQSVIRNSFTPPDEKTSEDNSMLGRVINSMLHATGEEDEEVPEDITVGEALEAVEDAGQDTIDEKEMEGTSEDTSEEEIVDEEEQEEIEEGPVLSETEKAQLAKRYEAIHNKLYVADLLITTAAILAFLFLGLSSNLRDWIHNITTNVWLVPLVYGAIITIIYYFVLLIPLHAIDFNYENKFKLNNQSFASWLDDNFKSLVLNILLVMLFLEVTYFLLRSAPGNWWIWAAGVWTIFGVLMANLMPVVILPLFYKLVPLEDSSLRDRLKGLVERVRLKVIDVYEMKLSRKTKKANAMLAGLGNTKRIILSDTLLQNFSEGEIETVIAHEIGHHYHKHVFKLIAFGTALSFVAFFLADQVLRTAIDGFGSLGITGVEDIAGFPLLIITIFIFGLLAMPISNALSRSLERQADRFALRLTDRPDEFISAMKKLADQNLADKEPSAVIEFLLHDHPSISRRITAAEDYSSRKRT